MLNKILSTYRNKVDRSDLDPSQYQNIASDIAITNWKRLRIFMALTLFFEILLIVFIDIPAVNASVPSELWLSRSYLILHIILGLTSFTGIVLTSVFLRNPQNQNHNNLYVVPVLLVIILTCLSIITGLDQIKTGEISAFVINLLVCSVVMLYPFKISFFIYTIPFGVFVAAMFIFEPDVAVRNSQRNIRDVDLACRWGGEEFLLLIPRTELEGISQLANRLCTMLAKMPMDTGGEKIPVTASFGVAMLTTQETEEDDFLTCFRLADKALYCAKQNGRNQVVITEPK